MTQAGPRGQPALETGAIQSPVCPQEEEPPSISVPFSLHGAASTPAPQTRYFSFMTSILRVSHQAPSCQVSPETGPVLRREDAGPPPPASSVPPSPGPGLRLTGLLSVTVCRSVPPLALGPKALSAPRLPLSAFSCSFFPVSISSEPRPCSSSYLPIRRWEDGGQGHSASGRALPPPPPSPLATL